MNHETLGVWKTSTELSINLYKSLKSSVLNYYSKLAANSSQLLLANGSCAELRTQIFIGIEIGYIERETGQDWMAKTKRIQIMLKKLSDRLRQ